MSTTWRPLLAIASLGPLAAATLVVLVASPPEPVHIQGPTAAAVPGPSAAACPGPLTVPEELVSTGGDPALAVQGPEPTASLRAVALETGSSLLYGRTTGTETARDENGDPVAPTASATTADGAPIELAGGAQVLGDRVGTATGIPGAAAVTLAAADGSTPVGDAVQSALTGQGDFRSLSLTRCTPPDVDATFLGASTTAGSSASLVLANATDRPATASVQVWTQDGPADMQGRSRVVVAPHSTESILLESIVPDQESVGARVVSVGAPLSMHVQSTRRDGLTPGGAEILSPLPEAGTDTMIPGVTATGTDDPELTILNPSGRDASVEIAVQGSEGPREGAAESPLTVPAGHLVRVPLTDLPAGDHAVRLTSDAPIEAVARSRIAGPDLPGDTVGSPVDFSIAEPAGAIGNASVLALPAEGPQGTLVLAATQDTGATVIPLGADGSAAEPITLDVGAGGVATVPSAQLGDAAALVVVPGAPGLLHGAWLQAPAAPGGGQLLSSVTVPGGRPAAPERSVTLD